MNRKETTEFLSNLLVERLSGRGICGVSREQRTHR